MAVQLQTGIFHDLQNHFIAVIHEKLRQIIENLAQLFPQKRKLHETNKSKQNYSSIVLDFRGQGSEKMHPC